MGTVGVKKKGEFCGEESLLKALSCYCNGRLRNATTLSSNQRARESERERKKAERERERLVNQSVTRQTTLCHQGFMIC